MGTPEPFSAGPVDGAGWSPPLPEAPGFDHRVIETPGLRTHLASIGEGAPVLLLHGFPEHWWQWREVAPIIAAAGYRVLCPDLRGAGWTVADDPRVERTTRLHDLLALLDVLDIESPHVVSHDMGAVTAMQLSYEHPERIRRAVQLSVPPGFMSFHPKVIPGFQHLPPFIWHRPGADLSPTFSEKYVAHPMSRETVAAHLAPLQRAEIDGAVRPLTRKMVASEGMRIVRGVYRRRTLTVPTRFVFGGADRYWNEEIMSLVCRDPQRHAEEADFAYVPDAAHFITDDAPTAVAELAIDWFRAGA